jgi:hypothetical protein
MGETDQDEGARRMTEWQPIETAPKDKLILIANWSGAFCNWARSERWNETDKCWGTRWQRFLPTHWLPMPPAPEVGEGDLERGQLP